MKNLVIATLLFSFISPVLTDSSSEPDMHRGEAAVILAGGIIDKKEIIDKKYPRKDCPVCKGKGWYISGDGIAKVDCGYCEEESKDLDLFEIDIIPSEKESIEEEKSKEQEIDEPELVPIKEPIVVQDPATKNIIIYRR